MNRISGLKFNSTINFSTSALLLLCLAMHSGAQHPNGRGAMSAQDMAKMEAGPLAANAGSGSCPNLAAGSAIAAPADLYSVNGVLEVTLNLQTNVDPAGRQRYCYVTPSGQFSPTLRVSPGDTLLIRFYNQIPAGLNPAVPAMMAGMPMAGSTHSMAAGMQMALNSQAASASSPVTVAL